MRFQITTQAGFIRLTQTNPEMLTDFERAARFLYLQRTCFSGKLSGKNFGVIMTGSALFNITKLVPMLEDLHARLAGVVIECLFYDAFIKRYDRPATLFYIDLPYYGGKKDYGKDMFESADFEKLVSLLTGIKGRFILSINDRPEIRALFADFYIDKVSTIYSVSSNQNVKKVNELLITN